MRSQENTRRPSDEPAALLADLWWCEYQDAAKKARDALRDGNKLEAIALAIQAYKSKGRYEYYANRLILG